MLRLHLLHALAAATVILCPDMYTPFAAGITRQWTNDFGDNSWYEDNNWSPIGIPPVDDTVILPSSSLADAGGAGITTDHGGSITANQSHIVCVDFTVGDNGQGTLDLNSGSSVTNENSYIGRNLGIGLATIRGAAWKNLGSMYVGGDDVAAGGTGTLTVDQGGLLEVDGTLKVWGPGDTVNLADDTSAILCESFYNFSTFSHTDGTLTIDGGRFQPALAVGVGTEYVITGGSTGENPTLILTGGARLGDTAAEVPNTIFIGNSGTRGTINVLDGAYLLSGGPIRIGHSGTRGDLLVNDATVEVGGMLEVGTRPGDGYLTIETGALVDGNAVQVGSTHYPGSGTITVTGGLFDINAVDILDSGTVNLQGGQISAFSITLQDSGSSFNFTGGRLSVGTFDGDLNNQGGTVAPGGSPGLTQVVGDYTQAPSGTLEIELYGTETTPSLQFDRLSAETLNLAGTLKVELGGGFVPEEGNSFAILDWVSTISGSFGVYDLPELTGLEWDRTDLYNTGIISVVAGSTVVPEPASIFMFALVATGILAFARRKRRK